MMKTNYGSYLKELDTVSKYGSKTKKYGISVFIAFGNTMKLLEIEKSMDLIFSYAKKITLLYFLGKQERAQALVASRGTRNKRYVMYF